LTKINPSPGDDGKKDAHELHELTRKKLIKSFCGCFTGPGEKKEVENIRR
jgi:hypothetical protein